MKRFFTIGLTVLFIFFSQILFAYDFKAGGIYYTINGATVSVVKGDNAYTGDVVIPNVVKYAEIEYPVTEIKAEAFSNNLSVSRLVIPSTVMSISEGEIIISGELVIEDSKYPLRFGRKRDASNYNDVSYYTAFRKSAITSLYVGRNIINTFLGPNGRYENNQFGFAPFASIPTLKSVVLGGYITEVGELWFNQCTSLRSIICLSVVPPAFCCEYTNYSHATYKFNVSEIIVPPSSIEAYQKTWVGCGVGTNGDAGQKIYDFRPIADVMFFEQQTASTYRAKMNSVDKSKVRSVAFYNGGIDESLTEEILTEGLNPNCVFLFPGNVELGCKNSINFENGLSEKIELDSKYPCEIPIETSVQNITISHTPSAWADGNRGWETIALPFECTNVEASEKGAIAPVMLGSTGNFWLRQYVGSSDDAVYFASTADGVMKANTPYLIAFPGDKMGKGSLEGQTITFKAKNVTLPATIIPTIQKNGYTFVGNYDTTADEGGGWTLNAEGNAFVWSETVGDKPFSAYFKGETPVAGASALRMSFGQMNNATGLEQNMADLIDHADETVYTLDGRKVNTKDLKPGLYIKNHKKMMVR